MTEPLKNNHQGPVQGNVSPSVSDSGKKEMTDSSLGEGGRKVYAFAIKGERKPIILNGELSKP